MSDTDIKITSGVFVAIEFAILLESGEQVGGSKPGQPFGFVIDRGQMQPTVEQHLLGMAVGEKTTFELSPAEAFGEREPENTRQIPREAFPANAELKVGMLFKPPGTQSPFPFTIQAISGDTVTVDMNHPLAGQKVRLNVTICEVRPLTEQEEAQLAAETAKPPSTGSLF